MVSRFSRPFLTASLLVLCCCAISVAWGKPPDLPLNFKDNCVPQVQGEPAMAPLPPVPWPPLFPDQATLDQWFGQEKKPLSVEIFVKQPVMDAEAFMVHQARHFYEIAGQCEQKGDLEMARNCYEEATRISPESSFGTLAASRLAALQINPANGGVVPAKFEVPLQPPRIIKEINREDRMEPRRLLESFRMLQMGENFRVAGELDSAFRCFQDAHAICPASRYGQAALDSMMEIERVRAEQQQELQRRRRVQAPDEQQPSATRTPPYSDDHLLRRDRAHAFFFLGESFLREGDIRQAYGFFQESHLACANCFYGMQAIERMHELEKQRLQGPEGERR